MNISPTQLLELAGLSHEDGLLKRLTEATNNDSVDAALKQACSSQPGSRLYVGLHSGGSDNVYETYFLATSPSAWSTYKPFGPGVIGVLRNFAGDRSEVGSLGRARRASAEDLEYAADAGNKTQAVINRLRVIATGENVDPAAAA